MLGLEGFLPGWCILENFWPLGSWFFLLLYTAFYLSQTNACLPEADLFIPGSDVLGQHVQARNNVLDAYYHPGHWGYIWGDKPGCVCVGMQCTTLCV